LGEDLAAVCCAALEFDTAACDLLSAVGFRFAVAFPDDFTTAL
jgi:hypothetical protein